MLTHRFDQPGTILRVPRTPLLDGTHLNWLIAEYIAWQRAHLDHQRTVDGYAYHLWWFTQWWQAQGPARDWQLRPADLVLFERHLRSTVSARTQRPLTYNTRATILKRLREALRWALNQGYVERDYTPWVPNADGGPPKRKAAAISALHHLLDAATAGPCPLRDRAILAMLMGMGLRREELSSLDIDAVVVEADHSGYAAVVGKRTRANPSGEREAAFDCATGNILVAYLDDDGRTQGPLFVGQRGNRLTGQGIYKVVKRLVAAAGLTDQIIGPHDLRRAFATHYRRNRKDKASGDLLRRQLGHASYSQTDEYTLLDVNDIRADLISPLALFAVADG